MSVKHKHNHRQTTPDMFFLEVAIPAPIWKTLTYSIDKEESLVEFFPEAEQLIGRRVLVPLSRRKLTGYILSVSQESPTGFSVKSIVELIDSTPLFHSNQVPFFRWIANYYHFPIGQVVETALPGGLNRKTGQRLVLNPETTTLANIGCELKGEEKTLFERIQDKGYLSIPATKKLLADKTISKQIKDLIKRKLVLLEQYLQHERSREKNEHCYRVLSSCNIELDNAGDLSQFDNQKQRIVDHYDQKLSIPEIKSLYLLELLAKDFKDGFISGLELRKRYKGSTTRLLDTMEKRGLIESAKRRIYRNPFGEQFEFVKQPETLTAEQNNVFEILLPAVEQKSYKPFLLHGVTGCGKTEVYLQCTEKMLDKGRDVLVLVPEIALATQLEAGFVSRFGDKVVLLHSGLTAGEKFDQWSLAATSKAKIVIGARSAIFAPLKDPGLIIVDEEHDTAYKQDDGFRYHARDLALLRGRFHDSVVILGSATPSITSFYHTTTGKYQLLTMEKRVARRPLPKVHIVDMRTVRETGGKKLFSDQLRQHLLTNFRRSKQSLLLLNRRGFSTTMICQECGNVCGCRHCHVSLTYHKKKNKLLCHYCDFQQRADIVCETCKSSTLVPFGFGTERVEEELKELLPEARTARLDADTGSDRKKFLTILRKMRNREIDILIGTQMIAKGHHFPHVTLVGVVWADSGLAIPDFKAAERTFQLLSQVTGRAGRGDQPGEVIIQTMHPNHYAIDYSGSHDYHRLYNDEISIRKTVGFPPFVKLINLRIVSESEFDVRQSALKIASFCRKTIHAMENSIDNIQKKPIEVSGPAPAPIDRIQGKYRWQILLKSNNIDLLHSLCRQVVDRQKKFLIGKAKLVIDVDPENLM